MAKLSVSVVFKIHLLTENYSRPATQCFYCVTICGWTYANFGSFNGSFMSGASKSDLFRVAKAVTRIG